MSLKIETVVSQPFEENGYIVWQEEEKECFVVDPGFEPENFLCFISEQELQVTAILNTHGHADHIAGNQVIKEAFPKAPLIIGSGDAPMLSDPIANLSMMGGMPVQSPPADTLLEHGQRVDLIGLSWEVREIPGHSPGHIVFVWHEGSPPIVFGGDVLFAGGIGRYDFPNGDGQLLVSGIREKLFRLPGQTIVFPGHGRPTTIETEIASNPFL